MAISLKPRKTESNLFCCSKWWGNPDLPPKAEYPMMKITEEDGTEGEYPLTFICQIDCEDIAPFDKESSSMRMTTLRCVSTTPATSTS